MTTLTYGRFGHINLEAIRISRRESTGAPSVGVENSVVFTGDLAKLEITPTVEQATTVQADAGTAGRSANSYDVPPKITGWTGVMRFSNWSDELGEITGVSTLITKPASGSNHQIVGSGYAASQTCATPGVDNGVIVEAWTDPVLCGSQIADADGDLLYRLIVMPYAKGFVFSEAFQPANEFFPYVLSFVLAPGTGNGLDNGPFNDLDDISPVNTDAPDQTLAWYDIWTETTPPSGTGGYVTVPADAS